MSGKRAAGLEGFALGDTTPQGKTSPTPEGTSVDPEPEAAAAYSFVPRVAAGPVSETSFIDDTEAPPPSYEAATSGYVEVPQDEEHRAPPKRMVAPIAEEEADSLTRDEIAMVLKMQDGRQDYLRQRSARFDGDEEMEMEERHNGQVLNPENFGASEDGVDDHRIGGDNWRWRETPRQVVHTSPQTTGDTVDSVSMHSMEAGVRREDRSDDDCTGYGPLNIPFTRVRRFLKSLSGTRLIIAVIVLVALMALVVFLGVFPASFVYVEYHQIALKRSKLTGAIDRENVYYPGCYVLGPDTKLVRFPATAQEIDLTMSVFTLDTISVEISFNLQYFLRPPEVGKLHADFAMDYEDFFRRLIISSVKNLAGMSITVDNFRFNRTYVEVQMHNMLREKLGGDCCPSCCPRNCQSNTFCQSCIWGGACNQGYHVDVRWFSLKRVSIPEAVFERYLHRTILGIKEETEFFLQNHTLITKETEKKTKKIKNEAEEIRQQANADGNRIKTVSEADYEKKVQYSYAHAWKGLYSNLSVTQEAHKLSLMMIKALDDIHENLYFGYGYEKNTIFVN